MAQIFWEQIRDLLPSGGEYLTGSLTVSGSLGTSGSIFYNGQLLEDFVDARAVSASTDFDQLTNLPSNLFSGSFLAGPNITINQIGQTVEISGSAATSYTSLTDIPAGIVSSSLQFSSLTTPFSGSFTGSFSGDASGLTNISITTSSISNFIDGIVSSSAGQAYIDSAVNGNLLSFTRLNGGSDSVDLGDIVPSTPTGSFLSSGSYDEGSGILTLFSDDINYSIDLSSLAGGGGGSSTVAGGAGIDVDYNVGTDTYTVAADVSSLFGTEIVGDYIGIATGSNHFRQGVLNLVSFSDAGGIFKQTGSYWSTNNILQITGSLDINISGSNREFKLVREGEEKFKLNNDGVIVFVSQSSAPTVVAGGMYYNQADDFYLGFQN